MVKLLEVKDQGGLFDDEPAPAPLPAAKLVPVEDPDVLGFFNEGENTIPITAPTRERRGDMGAQPLTKPRPDHLLDTPSLKHDRGETKEINGKWYMRLKRSGNIVNLDEDDPQFGVPTDDPTVLEAFGKTKPTKDAVQEIARQKVMNEAMPRQQPADQVIGQDGDTATPFQQYTQEGSKAFGKGAVDIVGMALKGFAGLTTDNPRRVKEVEAGLAGMQNMDDAAFADFVARIPENMDINPIAAINYQMAARAARKGEMAKAAEYLQTARGNTNTKPLKEQQAYKLGEKVEGSVAGPEFKPRPGWEKSLTVQLGQAGGSMMAFIPVGLIGGPAATGILGVGAGAGESVENAEQTLQTSTRDDRAGPYNAGVGTEAGEQVLRAAKLGTFPGATDAIPVESLIQRLPQIIPGLRQVSKTPGWTKFSKAIGQVVTQMALEGGQEGAQQYLQNVISQLTLEPGKELTEDVLHSILIGGAVGGIAETPVAAADALMGGKESPNAQLDASVAAEAARRKAAGLPPAPKPNSQAKADRGPVKGEDAWKLMKGAGYTLEDIRSMSPEQYAQTLEELRQQGAEPAATADMGKPKPPPGEAPMAPRGKKADQNDNQNDRSPQVDLPVVPGWPVQEEQTAPEIVQNEQLPPADRSVADLQDGASSQEPEIIDLPSGGKLVSVKSEDVFGDGTRAKPIAVDDATDLEPVREQVAPEPTDGQKEAGNYKKGHVKLHGLDISIETAKGGTRTSKADSPEKWSVEMQDDYGQIKGTVGADGEPVDVFIGPNPKSSRAWVIKQNDLKTGKYDEDKVILGANSEAEAQEIYARAFSDGKGEERIGGIEEMEASSVKGWLQDQGSKPAKAQDEPDKPLSPEMSALHDELTTALEKPGNNQEEIRLINNRISLLGDKESGKPYFTSFDKEEREAFFIEQGRSAKQAKKLSEITRHTDLSPEDQALFRESDFSPKNEPATEEAGRADADLVALSKGEKITPAAKKRLIKEGLIQGAKGVITDKGKVELEKVPAPKSPYTPEEEARREKDRLASVAEHEEFKEKHQPRIETDSLPDPKRPQAVNWADIHTLEIDGKWVMSVGWNLPKSGHGGLPSLDGEKFDSKAGAQEAAAKKILKAVYDDNGAQAQKIRLWVKQFLSEKERAETFLPEKSSTEKAPETQAPKPEVDEKPAQEDETRPPAEEIDETEEADNESGVEPRLTSEGPWDFNDTYPAPDAEKLERLTKERPSPFNDPADVEEVSSLIEESLTELQMAFLDQKYLGRTIAQIDKGTAKLKRGVDPQVEKKKLKAESDKAGQTIKETQAALEEVFSDDAAHEIVAAAQARAEQEWTQTDKGVEADRPTVSDREPAASPLTPADDKGLDPLVTAFRDRLLDPDGGFATITEARAFAAERGFVKGEDADNKVLEEKIELAVVLAARDLVKATRKNGRSVGLAYDRLVELYKRQPKLGTRTSKSMAEQAYSTPAPIAFLASRLAKVDQAKSVLEPTAGNGMLLMEAPTEDHSITVNELDDTRAANLRAQGFYVSQKDAAAEQLRHKGYPVQSIIMNPPFGAVMSEKGGSTVYKVGDWETTRIDYAIALRQLESLAEDGRAVLILGGPAKTALSETGQKEFYRAKAQREFYWRLGQSYKVVDHFTIRGELYARQGAGWPIDVVVIEGKGKSERPLPGVTPPPIFDTFDALKEKLYGFGFDRERGGPPATPDPGQPGPAASDEGSDGPPPAGGSPVIEPTDVEPLPVRDGRGDGEPGISGDRGDAPRGVEPEPGARPDDRTVDQSGDPKPSPPRLKQPVSTEPTSGESALQRKYEPAAKSAKSLGMLVPANMQTATQDALAAIGEEVDGFVARNLKYREDDLKKHFAAEQIDAIALAIKEYQRGGALIIGDQTGAGKGRVVAALIRYALIQGQVPVFLTEKPDLYGDMYRDMNDIGLPAFLKRDVGIFATNSGAVIPLDDEAVEWKGEYDEAKKAGDKLPPRRGTFLKTGTAESVKKGMLDATAESVPGYDVVFTTYDQTNTVKGADTERRAFLRKMMPNAFLILDEAHNAGGGDQGGWETSENGPKNRADFIREIVETAKGVMYSSATYAKRPDVMDLYRRTDMAKAVKNIDDLGETIAKGGVPLQQVTAAMLAQQGQYIRRERSFEGIEYALREIDVDRQVYDNFSDALRAVQMFDLIAQGEIAEVMDEVLAEQGLAVSKDPSVGIAGASQTGFSSVMHNLVNQMLLAIKVDGTVLEVLDTLERGEKPTIALANTMESFIDDYAETKGLKTGDVIDLNFEAALKRYLDRTLRITVKNHDKTKTHIQVPVSKLSTAAQQLYGAALHTIENSGIGSLPISPIDALRHGIEKAGYKVKEITGRKRVIDYSGKKPVLKARDPGEMGSGGKRVSVKAYNDGRTDVIIFNRSGSTGISMHASPKFKDKRKRVMLLQQAEGNIDTHMQTLGRINRTGQLVLPAYKQLAAKIPAEARPAAVLLRKMASLNASTTASRKGALNDESIVDFINEYGDRVVYDLMGEHPDLARVMGIEFGGEEDVRNAAAKVTGKMTLLKLDEQEMLLDAIASNYKSLIAQLDATGENMLEAKSLDLQAKPMQVKEMKPRMGASVFEDGIYAEWSSVKSDGKSYNGADLVRALADEIGESNVTKENAIERWREISAKMKAAHDLNVVKDSASSYARESIAALKDPAARERLQEKLRDNYRRFYGLMGVLEPGSVITLKGKEGGADQQAVVIWTRRTGAGKNPAGLGSWEVKLALPSSYRTLTVHFSQLYTPAFPIPEGGKGFNIEAPQVTDELRAKVLEAYDDASKSGREDRWIFTGNLLGGFEMVGKGQIINFTSDDGRIRQGVLMPKEWDMADFNKKRPIEFGTAAQVSEFLDRAQDKAIMSRDGLIDLVVSNYGRQVEIAASRALGGKYFLNPAVRRATDDKLTKAGSKVRWQTQDKAAFRDAIDALIKAGARFQTTNEQDLAISIVNPDKGPPEGPGGGQSVSQPGPRQMLGFYSGLLDTVQNSKQAKATARQWMGMIRNAPGVKKEELEWIGLKEWLAAKGDEPVTRHDVAEFVAANQIEVQEVDKSGKAVEASFSFYGWQDADEELTQHIEVFVDGEKHLFNAVHNLESGETSIKNDNGEEVINLGRPSRATNRQPDNPQLERNIRVHLEEELGVEFGAEQTEFSSYTLPGGQGYHELLLTLPKGSPADTYKSPHWDEKNVLAHIRFNERTDAEGKRVLFIEEVQSDWHQQGRRGGYQDAAREKEISREANALSKELAQINARLTMAALGSSDAPEMMHRRNQITERMAELSEDRRDLMRRVPDAPFKTTWPELALKRMVRWAAENGFDRIAWTPGDVQADRYDLSKQVESVFYRKTGDSFYVSIRRKGASRGEGVGTYKADDLSGVVGKELAEKILAGEGAQVGFYGEDAGTMELSGLDLKIGGEGMRSFYDRELVNVANKLGKRFGAKVGKTRINISGAKPTAHADFAAWEKAQKEAAEVHSIDVTPEMRKAVMGGQTVFDAGTAAQVDRLSEAERTKIIQDIVDLSYTMLGHRIQVAVPSTIRTGTMGEYTNQSRVIHVAIETARQYARGTFSHEVIHAMRDTGIITKPEWGVLKRWAEQEIMPSAWWQDRAKDWNYDTKGVANLDELMVEEAIAEAFAHYMMRKPGQPVYPVPNGLVATILQKLRLFFERLRAYLEGAGFRTAEDLFADIEAGKMRDRPMLPMGRTAKSWGFEPSLDIPSPAAAEQPQAVAQPPMRRRMPPSRNTARTFMEPEDSAIAVLTNRNLPLLTRVSGGLGNAFAPVRKAVQDRMIHWRRVQAAIEQQLGPINPSDDVYRTETLMAGRTGERLEDFRMDDLDPLVEEMAALDVTKEELDEYLIANHAPERNAYIATINPRFPDGGSGMMTADAQQITANARPEVVQVARRVYRMLSETRDRLLREGIIDQATYNQWTKQYQFYVPLKGFEADPEEGARLTQGTRYDSRARVTEAAMGRSSTADSPLAYTIAGAQQSIILAEKARVGRSVLRLARRYPNTNLWEVNQVVMKRYISKATGLVTSRPDNQKRVLAENVLAVRVGGNLYWVTLHHQGLAAGVKGMDAPSVNAIFRYLINFNRYLALVRTGWDPQFFIPNFLRDVQTAGVHLSAEQGARLAAKIAKDIPKAMRGSWRGSRGNLTGPWANFYREFAQAGGKVGIWGLDDIETIKGKVNRQLRRAKGGPLNRFILGATWARQAMEDVNGAIENAVRLSTYVNMRRAGYSQDEAAYAAKEVTVNFNRKGEWSTAINTMYLFANASIQGTSRVAMVLAKSKLARRVALGLFVTGILQDFMNSALSGAGDDDDQDAYDAIPEYIRERNLIFMTGGAKGEHIKIPLPWVYNVFHYAGTNVGRYLRGKVKPMEASTNIAASALQAANPVQSATWLQMVMPTFLDPWVDLYVNEDWKGAPIMPPVSQYDKTPPPDSQRFFESVGPWYKGTAETLNSVTGGNEVRPGAIDVSPESLEYISDFLFGGVKMTVEQMATTATKLARGEEIEMERVPFVRKVFGRESPQTGRDEYYDMRDAAALTNADLKSAIEDGDQERIARIKRDYPADLKAEPLFKEFDKLLKKLNKARKAAPDSETRENIRVKMDEIRAKARKAYRKLEEEAAQ